VLYPAADRALGHAELRSRLGDGFRRWFVCGSPARFSPTLGILETNGIGATRPLEAIFAALGARSVHDPASELRTIYLLRTRVNRAALNPS
jgi:hypothetical protein